MFGSSNGNMVILPSGTPITVLFIGVENGEGVFDKESGSHHNLSDPQIRFSGLEKEDLISINR